MTPSNTLKNRIRQLYVTWIRPHFKSNLHQQRFKLLWMVWGYYPLFSLPHWSWWERLAILKKFLVIDWQLEHAHRPIEIARIATILSERKAAAGEVVIEAGCWNGGSSAKFSLICQKIGYQLRVYDSFQGVEPMSLEAKANNYDFSGEYAATQESVINNIKKYGELSVCTFYPGWFADTLAAKPVTVPVRAVYIDCDLAKGTQEVLQGVSQSLASDVCIFSQDFHIKPVREALLNPEMWQRYHLPFPQVDQLSEQLAVMRFTPKKISYVAE